MLFFLISLMASSLMAALIIRSQKIHGHLTFDTDLKGPQKFHKNMVARIGGVAIFFGFASSIITYSIINGFINPGFALLLCSAPVFVVGLLEDLTKKISIRVRLFFTGSGAFLATILLGAKITSIDISVFDLLLITPMISIPFTVFAITGLANAYNIIDGFNGLSSMVAILALLALTYVGIKVDDHMVIFLSSSMIAAIVGFFIWNYPKGLIFLGDSGAYLIGFWVATLSTLIVCQHKNVSPWFALLLNAYPIWETIFTMYRRKFYQNKNIGHPDGVHFHSLIYRRILNNKPIKRRNGSFTANSKTSPYLWVLSLLTAIPATLFWDATNLIIMFFIIFAASYVWIYWRIVHFQTPKWMRIFN